MDKPKLRVFLWIDTVQVPLLGQCGMLRIAWEIWLRKSKNASWEPSYCSDRANHAIPLVREARMALQTVSVSQNWDHKSWYSSLSWFSREWGPWAATGDGEWPAPKSPGKTRDPKVRVKTIFLKPGRRLYEWSQQNVMGVTQVQGIRDQKTRFYKYCKSRSQAKVEVLGVSPSPIDHAKGSSKSMTKATPVAKWWGI